MEGLLDDSHQPQRHIIDRQFLVTSAQSAILLVPADHPLNDVALPIGRSVEALISWLVRLRRDHCGDVPPPTPAANAGIAVSLVPRQALRPTALTPALVKQAPGHRRLQRLALMRLTGCDVDGHDETVAITHQVDLGPEPAPRPPERMVGRLLHLRRLTSAQPPRAAPPFSPLRRPPDWHGRRCRRYTRGRGRSAPRRPTRPAAR
jgi:hypothetical protein